MGVSHARNHGSSRNHQPSRLIASSADQTLPDSIFAAANVVTTTFAVPTTPLALLVWEEIILGPRPTHRQALLLVCRKNVGIRVFESGPPVEIHNFNGLARLVANDISLDIDWPMSGRRALGVEHLNAPKVFEVHTRAVGFARRICPEDHTARSRI